MTVGYSTLSSSTTATRQIDASDTRVITIAGYSSDGTICSYGKRGSEGKDVYETYSSPSGHMPVVSSYLVQ